MKEVLNVQYKVILLKVLMTREIIKIQDAFSVFNCGKYALLPL